MYRRFSGNDLEYSHHIRHSEPEDEDIRRFSLDQFQNHVFVSEINGLSEMYRRPPLSDADVMQMPEGFSPDGNDKFLLFSMLMHRYPLLDSSMNKASISLHAKLDGSFLAAEADLAASFPSSTRDGLSNVVELTCYRRNLFQIEGSVMIPRNLRYFISETGERMPISGLELAVSATESVEGQPVKIVSVPWKSTANSTVLSPNANEDSDKGEKEPTTIPLDGVSSQDYDFDYETVPVSWRRLQFRNATANNGRRKELQQHYTVKLSVLATSIDGHKVSLCDTISGPIIVRGRSPRNFQSRRDVPISGSAATARRNSQAVLRRASATSASSGDSQKSHKLPTNVRDSIRRYSSPNSDASSLTSITMGTAVSQAGASSAAPLLFQSSFPSTIPESAEIGDPSTSISPYKHPLSDFDSTARISAPSVLSAEIPMYADLLDRKPIINSPRSLATSSSDGTSSSVVGIKRSASAMSPPLDADGLLEPSTKKRMSPSASSSFSSQTASSDSEFEPSSPTFPLRFTYPGYTHEADQLGWNCSGDTGLTTHTADAPNVLYEYFPLTPEDWQAPVDGFYRPHVAYQHHRSADSTDFASLFLSEAA